MTWHTIGMVPGTTISRLHRAGSAVAESLRPIEAAVAEFAADHALDVRIEQRLAIVVEEIVTNVIHHAAHERDIMLSVRLENDDCGVIATFGDDSEPFDPRSAAVPDRPDPEHGGGVGLTLVRAWTEILAFESSNGENRLVLRLRPLPDL